MALTLLSNTPIANQVDVVLQADIRITFNMPIATGSVTESTFVVYSEGSTIVRAASGELIENRPDYPYTVTDYIEGTFSFTTGYNTVIFTPSKPLKASTTYTVLLAGYDVGADNKTYLYASNGIDRLETTVRWTFTTGVLVAAQPPDKSAEISYDELLADVNNIIDASSGGASAGSSVSTPGVRVSPSNGAFNVMIVDDVLYTFTFTEPINPSSVNPKLYLKSLDGLNQNIIEVPVLAEMVGDKILKIKFR